MGKLFGTDGVRGLTFAEMNPQLAFKIASATCTRFGEGSSFLIGRDVRIGGEMLKAAVISGLLYSGCKATDLGLIPTPGLQYLVSTDDSVDGGIMITASHNPPEYNGIKVIDADGIEIPREKEREIENIIFEDRIKARKWSHLEDTVNQVTNAIQKYVNAVVERVETGPSISETKVIIDAANSVGSLVVPNVVKKLGAKPITINGHLDPAFPAREPEPTPETLLEASKTVVVLSGSVGVGLDGDADRSIFIDEQGRVLWGDRTAIPLAIHLSDKHPELPKRVYTGISSSFFIEEELKKHGIEVVWMKVGSVDISRRLNQEGGLMGFEENGGTMYPVHHPVRDAAMTTALILEMLSKRGKPLSTLVDAHYPRTFTIKTKIPMDRAKAEKAVGIVKNAFKGKRMIEIDGVKILLDNAWILVRPSGTEPVLRIMIEALEEEYAGRLLKDIKEMIADVK